MLIKYSYDGQIQWQQTFAGNAGKDDYGIALTQDDSGNFLVLGAVTTNNATSDFVVLKYDSDGNLLWSSVWDGSNNQLDLPTAITTDDLGYIYVAGGTVDFSGQADWRVFKFSPDGIMLWAYSYNYDNQHDMPVLLSPISGSINIYGFSGQTQTTGELMWDAVKLQLDASTGVQLAEKRQALPYLSSSEVVAMAKDAASNLYIAYSAMEVAGNSDIKLMKLNTAFDSVWTQTIDADAQADQVRALAIDNEGNPLLAGISHYATGGTQITMAKFSPTGTTLFSTAYRPPYLSWGVDVSQIEINSEGDVFLACAADRQDSQDALLLIYDQDGTLRAEKIFDSGNASDDSPTGLSISNAGEIFLTGKSEGSTSGQFALKYQFIKRNQQVVLVDSTPHHVAQEVIVRFLPEYVDSAFVDNRELFYGSLYEALSDEAAAYLENRMDYLRQTTFVKVFPRLTTAHTHSISRLGDTISIPPFWATYVLLLPQNENPDSVVAQFESLTDYVEYAELNYLLQLDTPKRPTHTNDQNALSFPGPANDPLYDLQGSLSGTFNANINVENAWELETGRNYVKVGVIDHPIFWGHEDFGDGTFEGSQIKGGWDYRDNISISSVLFPLNSHGTAVAGIIGALRDNQTGIAGIAGGGFDGTGKSNIGVQLFSLAIAGMEENSEDFIPLSDIAPAIEEGAMYNPSIDPPGYGLHIMNASWGTGMNSQSLRRAIHFTWKNSCTFVASRGNDGIDDYSYPSSYPDNWVLSVGASGTDGERYSGTQGDNFNPWASNFGKDMDFIAPGVTDLVLTTIYHNAPFFTNVPFNAPQPIGNGGHYQAFNGTSASAPHVVGVSALLYGIHNTEHPEYPQPNNLAPEDIEHILQQSAQDVGAIGYDDHNGWGRIDATAALEMVQGPDWQIWHSGTPQSTMEETVLIIPQPPLGYTKVIEVTHTYYNQFSNYLVEDAWPLFGKTNGTSLIGGLQTDWADYQFQISGNQATVTATTYKYEYYPIPGVLLYTFPSGTIQTAYSLHLHSTTTATTENQNSDWLQISPNPGRAEFTLSFNLSQDHANRFRILDLNGRVIQEEKVVALSKASLHVTTVQLKAGIYVFQLITDKNILSKKVIIQ